MLKRLILLFMAVVATPAVLAQASYTSQSISYAWISTSGHAVVGTGTAAWDNTLGCPDASGDDSLSVPLNIGFSFTFGANTYTQVRVMSNGRLQFNNTYCGPGTLANGPPRTYPNAYPDANLANTIKIYGADFYNVGAGTGSITYATTGTAPNQIFVVTWNGVPQRAAPGTSYNLQIQLNQDGSFSFMYGSSVNTSGGTTMGPADLGYELSTSDYLAQSGLPANNSALRYAATGPVAFYHMDETKWNGTAGEVLDASGNFYGGTAATAVKNTPSTAAGTPAITGNPGTCRYGKFAGASSEYVALSSALPHMGGTFTVAAWIYPTDTGVTHKHQRVWADDQNGKGYGISYGDGGPNTMRLYINTPWIVDLDSKAVLTIKNWYFIAATWDLAGTGTMSYSIWNTSGTLLDSGSVALPGFGADTGTITIGGLPAGSPNAGYWYGSIDELGLWDRVLSPSEIATQRGATHNCSTAADHFLITNSAYGIYCLASPVTVQVLDAGNNPVTNYTGTIALTTSTGAGSWTKVSSYGTLTQSVANSGSATYKWSTTHSSASFNLTYSSGPTPVTLNAVDTSNSDLTDDNSQPPIAFSPSGFTVTSTPISAPISSVPPFSPTYTAGSTMPVYLTAYGQTPTGSCGLITGYAGNEALNFWTTAVNPAAPVLAATVNGVAVGASEAASGAQTVAFGAGQATVSFKYKDVGSLSLSVKDASTGNPGLPNGIRGSTGSFVAMPANFVFSQVKRTSDGFANPGTTTAGGTVFAKAGLSFSATVTVVDAEGSATPSFGHESSPESVGINVSLLLPASGNAPAVSLGGGFGSFTNGVATATALSWSEVGSIGFVGHIADGSYLSGGDVFGSVSGAVGRFTPASFAIAQNTPVLQTGCIAGGFTYVGQPLSYTVAPVVTVTALAQGGSTTQNYAASLFRLTDASLGARTYASAQTLDLSGLPAVTSDPTIVAQGAGVGTLTYSAGSGIKFAQGAPVAPFAGAISLTQTVTDLDGVTGSAPASFGASGGMLFSAGAQLYSGRLRIVNAAGSELLDLPVPLRTEYYTGSALGFTPNTSDSCTAAPALSLGAFRGALAAGASCVRDSGSPGLSGLGCSAAGPASEQYQSAHSGSFNLNFAAPGAGSTGAAVLQATAPSWLQYLWNGASGGLQSPTGLVGFGMYQGPKTRVYEREVY
jgi:MSHA biogenesis protein MshQ